MLNTSRANLISKIIFTICVLIATVTVFLVTHELITNNRHTMLLLQRTINQQDLQSLDTKTASGLKTHVGLLDLIANVTQAVVAMETQAQQLDEELQRMRQKTRQLLWQRKKDALWTAIHKCIFFYGCDKQNFISHSVTNGINKDKSKQNMSYEVEILNELLMKNNEKFKQK